MRFYLESYGCTMNQGEGELFRRRLLHAGHDQAGSMDRSDVNLLFTCVVIRNTEVRMVKRIRELAATGTPLVVAGCLVTTFPDKITKIEPRALLIPPRQLATTDIAALERWVTGGRGTGTGGPPNGNGEPCMTGGPVANGGVGEGENVFSTNGKDGTVGNVRAGGSTRTGTGLPTGRKNRCRGATPGAGECYRLEEVFPAQWPGAIGRSGGRIGPGGSGYRETSEPVAPGEPEERDHSYFVVPISQGCLGTCTYCITRQARGSLASYPPDDILHLVRTALASGYTEIRLTSQDTAIYGLDKGTSLPVLLGTMATPGKGYGDFRIRVGMMNPRGTLPILDDLIRSFTSPRIYSFLHMPVQSGDDAILSSMGRGYTVEDVKTILGAFRDAIPDLTFSTDIITGFPGETDDSFRVTMDLVEELRPDIVNITRYSERPGTRAATLGGQVHGRTSKERSRRLTELRFRISAEIHAGFLGKQLHVLATERGRGGTTLCRDDRYRSVAIREQLPLGRWYSVEIVDSTDVYLLGRRIFPPP